MNEREFLDEYGNLPDNNRNRILLEATSEAAKAGIILAASGKITKEGTINLFMSAVYKLSMLNGRELTEAETCIMHNEFVSLLVNSK